MAKCIQTIMMVCTHQSSVSDDICQCLKLGCCHQSSAAEARRETNGDNCSPMISQELVSVGLRPTPVQKGISLYPVQVQTSLGFRAFRTMCLLCHAQRCWRSKETSFLEILISEDRACHPVFQPPGSPSTGIPRGICMLYPDLLYGNFSSRQCRTLARVRPSLIQGQSPLYFRPNAAPAKRKAWALSDPTSGK